MIIIDRLQPQGKNNLTKNNFSSWNSLLQDWITIYLGGRGHYFDFFLTQPISWDFGVILEMKGKYPAFLFNRWNGKENWNTISLPFYGICVFSVYEKARGVLGLGKNKVL